MFPSRASSRRRASLIAMIALTSWQYHGPSSSSSTAITTAVAAFQVYTPLSIPHTNSHGSTCTGSCVHSSSTSGRFTASQHHGRSSVNNFQKKSRRASQQRSNLSMHMGHSHSHNHHHNHSHDSTASLIPSIKPKQLLSKQFLLRILFSAVAVLGPPLLLFRRSLTKTDSTVFLLTVTALSGLDKCKAQIKVLIERYKQFKYGLSKHAPKKFEPTRFLFRNENPADRVTLIGVVINLLLSVGKAVAGVSCHSSALIADAGHSLSDLFSDFITLWAVQIARLPPDDDHPYGHGKFEAVGSLFLALTLFGTGVSVGLSSNAKMMKILSAQAANHAAAAGSAAAKTVAVQIPTMGALVMAAISITSKEWLYRITRTVGEKLNSQVVIANAWHHRSDAYSSILALGSIGLAMSIPGMAAADAAAGLLVAGMICMTGAEIMSEAVKQLTDTSDIELVERIKNIVAEESEDILEVKRVRARWMGSSAIVDLTIETPLNLSASATRAVEERVRFKIMKEEPGILDAEVHAVSEELTCPLLTATGETKSAHMVEEDSKNVLLEHPEVDSVESCTVHYQDTLLAHLDANIKLKDSDRRTVTSATMVAAELRDILEESECIHKAHIFLDLNSGVTSDKFA